MSISRNVLLWASENHWLEQQFRRRRFARKAVSRFMPGENAEDALGASAQLATHGISAILTRLGENVTAAGDIEHVVAHYLDVYDQIQQRGLDAHISIKLTQLGLDLDTELAWHHLAILLDRATQQGNFLWIDMEQSEYVDRTLELYRRARAASPAVGICLQAYLHRTESDLRELLHHDGTVRLVKGAYREPPTIAWPRKADVDTNYVRLAKLMVDHGGERAPAPEFGNRRHAIATHDLGIVTAVTEYARESGAGTDGFEIDMLYGIRAAEQIRIAGSGVPMRVLISYGESWYPWYVRRLAERPANVGFVVRSMFMQ